MRRCTLHGECTGANGHSENCMKADGSVILYRREQEPLPANAHQVGGDHYRTAIQPWDFVLANELGFLEGNAIKYISRHRKTQTGKKDLEKAIHYLQKAIEHYYDPKST